MEASALVWTIRLMILTSLVLGYFLRDNIQLIVNLTWDYLLDCWVFNCVYFETWWTAVCNTLIILPLYKLLDSIPQFKKYKIDPAHTWQKFTWYEFFKEIVVYCTPLMLLDTFLVKQYRGTGIDPNIWIERRKSLIQYTRELPRDPPSVEQILLQLVLSLILFDAMFFTAHFILHKKRWLYKYFHALHHDHPVLNSHVTNQLSVVERTVLVLAANEGLRIIHGHPLTRVIFVPIFLALITENHSAFDWPWGLDKIVPWNIVGLSRHHFIHHTKGSGNYQPFFTYLDKLVDKYQLDLDCKQHVKAKCN